jgi:fucose 4-O-acetylase-like acetyltransferase
MTRHNSIDMARGMAILCVVCGHLTMRMAPAFYRVHLEAVDSMVFSFVMPFFFMVSAIFIRKRVENVSISGKEFLRAICSSTLKPFYTLSTLFLIVNLVAPKSLGLPGAWEMIKSLLIEQSGEGAPSGVLWFLFVLFIFSLVAFVLLRLLKLNVFVLLAIAVVLRVFAGSLRDYHYFAIDKISYFYVYYMTGYVLSELILNARILRNKALLASFFAYWLITAGRQKVWKVPWAPVWTWITGYHILVGVAGSLFLLGISKVIDDHFPSGAVVRFLRYCGRNSILIYVFHTPTALVVEKLNSHLGLSSNAIGYVFLCLTGIFMPLVYGRILNRIPFAYGLLLGRGPH